MSQQHSVAHAKNNLPALIHDVEHGAKVEITRHGRPVAVLLSVAEYRRLQGDKPDAWERLQAFRARHDMTELGIDDVLRDVRDDSVARPFSW